MSMDAGKPIIGIVGGIGSGKSFVAGLFGELGCLVINSDDAVSRAYERDDVRDALRAWWGDAAFKADGSVDRKFIAERVFEHPNEKERLEGLLHPLVAIERDRIMEQARTDPQVLAYVWDTPLLFEADLAKFCDAVVFVDAPEDVRLKRVEKRGWDRAELRRRENLQLPLDKKRALSDYVLNNTADADSLRGQIREVLSQILATKRS
jgi:dephospho-CoA kinase